MNRTSRSGNSTAIMDTSKDTTKTEHVELAEMREVKMASPDSTSEVKEPVSQPETRMTKAKWLACIALCISYSTAYQQNAVTAAIAKHIDDELGKDTTPLRSTTTI